MRKMYGWRARIGVILVAPDVTAEGEFPRMAPEGVAFHYTRVSLAERYGTPEALENTAKYVEEAAKLLASANVDVIAYACTAASFVKGSGYDKELIKKIETTTEIPATTMATAVVDALRELEVKKVAVATPYPSVINDLEKKFLEGNGFDVLNMKSLQIEDCADLAKVPPETIYRFARKVYEETLKADGIFISCGGLNTIDIIDKLEQDLRKPVISSNQATFWAALKMAKVNEPIKGYGRLLKNHFCGAV